MYSSIRNWGRGQGQGPSQSVSRAQGRGRGHGCGLGWGWCRSSTVLAAAVVWLALVASTGGTTGSTGGTAYTAGRTGGTAGGDVDLSLGASSGPAAAAAATEPAPPTRPPAQHDHRQGAPAVLQGPAALRASTGEAEGAGVGKATAEPAGAAAAALVRDPVAVQASIWHQNMQAKRKTDVLHGNERGDDVAGEDGARVAEEETSEAGVTDAEETEEEDGKRRLSVGLLSLLYAAAALLTTAGAVSYHFGLGIHASILIAVARVSVQVLALGYLVSPAAHHPSWWVTLLLFAALATLASLEAASRPRFCYKALPQHAALAVIGGTALGLAYCLLIVAPSLRSFKFILPLAGLLLGQVITGVSAALSALLQTTIADRDYIEVLLALGASRTEALASTMQSALGAAISPLLGQISVMGLVSMPSVMAGLMLQGAEPTQAAKLQLCLLLVAAASAIAAIVAALLLASRALVNDRHQLALHLVWRRQHAEGLPAMAWHQCRIAFSAVQRVALRLYFSCCRIRPSRASKLRQPGFQVAGRSADQGPHGQQSMYLRLYNRQDTPQPSGGYGHADVGSESEDEGLSGHEGLSECGQTGNQDAAFVSGQQGSHAVTSTIAPGPWSPGRLEPRAMGAGTPGGFDPGVIGGFDPGVMGTVAGARGGPSSTGDVGSSAARHGAHGAREEGLRRVWGGAASTGRQPGESVASTREGRVLATQHQHAEGSGGGMLRASASMLVGFGRRQTPGPGPGHADPWTTPPPAPSPPPARSYLPWIWARLSRPPRTPCTPDLPAASGSVGSPASTLLPPVSGAQYGGNTAAAAAASPILANPAATPAHAAMPAASAGGARPFTASYGTSQSIRVPLVPGFARGHASGAGNRHHDRSQDRVRLQDGTAERLDRHVGLSTWGRGSHMGGDSFQSADSEELLSAAGELLSPPEGVEGVLSNGAGGMCVLSPASQHSSRGYTLAGQTQADASSVEVSSSGPSPAGGRPGHGYL